MGNANIVFNNTRFLNAKAEDKGSIIYMHAVKINMLLNYTDVYCYDEDSDFAPLLAEAEK